MGDRCRALSGVVVALVGSWVLTTVVRSGRGLHSLLGLANGRDDSCRGIVLSSESFDDLVEVDKLREQRVILDCFLAQRFDETLEAFQ